MRIIRAEYKLGRAGKAQVAEEIHTEMTCLAFVPMETCPLLVLMPRAMRSKEQRNEREGPNQERERGEMRSAAKTNERVAKQLRDKAKIMSERQCRTNERQFLRAIDP